VNAREEAYRMTKQRFDAGAVPYVEYQVAENDLFQAKSDLVRAKYDFHTEEKSARFLSRQTDRILIHTPNGKAKKEI
jgi:outer membrane protein